MKSLTDLVRYYVNIDLKALTFGQVTAANNL